jgi:hypothetical protein
MYEETSRWHGDSPGIASDLPLVATSHQLGYRTPKVGSLDPYEELLDGPLSAYPAGAGAAVWTLWVRIRRQWLDFLIARGSSPGTSSALTLRARQLTSRATRTRLTDRINEILRFSGDARRWRLTIAPDRVSIDSARAELQAIAEIVDGQSLVYARGVAMVVELLQSPSSPLFDPGKADPARQRARLSLLALQGHI